MIITVTTAFTLFVAFILYSTYIKRKSNNLSKYCNLTPKYRILEVSDIDNTIFFIVEEYYFNVPNRYNNTEMIPCYVPLFYKENSFQIKRFGKLKQAQAELNNYIKTNPEAKIDYYANIVSKQLSNDNKNSNVGNVNDEMADEEINIGEEPVIVKQLSKGKAVKVVSFSNNN